jgi:hypothetical protein
VSKRHLRSDELRAASAQHGRGWLRRNLTSPEAREMAERAHVARFLNQLRRVRWPDDPMNGAQCASVLGVSRAAVTQGARKGG